MSLDGAISIASSGLSNVARELAIVSRNISNANTPDYTREVANQTSVLADGVGMGVAALPTSRDLDISLQAQVFRQGSVVAGLQTTQTALRVIDAAQGSPGNGDDLSSMLGQVQDAFSTLANDPSNQAQQAKVVDAASTLAHKMNALSAAYAAARQGAQDGIVGDVTAANADLATIGQLSNQVVSLRASGQSTADIENQRDAVMHQLASLTGARFLEQSNGDMLAIASNGLSLPVHETSPLAAPNAATGAGASYPAGGLPAITLNGADVTSQLTGGTIGARITLRDATLPKFQAQLDQFAQTLASRFDRQGLTLFTDPTGAVPSGGGSPAQQGYVGFAGIIGVNPLVAAAPALVRDGTRPVVDDPAGPSAFTPNPSGGPAGFTDLISRVLDFALGTQSRAGVDQASVPSSGLGPTGGLNAGFAVPPDLAGFAATLVAAQSQDSANVSASLGTETALQTNLQGRLSSGSAVNIDTEMSTMLSLQNSYGANARVMSTVQSMWTDLLAAIH